MNKQEIVSGICHILKYDNFHDSIHDTKNNEYYNKDTILLDLNVLKKAYKATREKVPDINLYSRWADLLMCPESCENDYTLVFAHVLVSYYAENVGWNG